MSRYERIVKTLPHEMDEANQAERGPSIASAVKYIDEMDFSLVKLKLTAHDPLLCRKWSALEFELGFQYYKNFLFLNKKYLSLYPVLPPSLEVDEIWHHHILDTRQYYKDCFAIFGRYFHHYPYFGTRNDEDLENLEVAFERTQQLHEFEFGARMISFWGLT